jgi:hypothetical protein
MGNVFCRARLETQDNTHSAFSSSAWHFGSEPQRPKNTAFSTKRCLFYFPVLGHRSVRENKWETCFAVRAWRGSIILTTHSRAALGTPGLSLSGRRTKLYQQNVAFFIFPYCQGSCVQREPADSTDRNRQTHHD